MSAGSNRFGNLFQWTSFGESHGRAMGVVVDGCPAGLTFDLALLEKRLQERRPGQSALVSGRQESDQVEVLSGVFEEKTLGTPIAMLVWNQDARSQDYEAIKKSPRRGHADDLWKLKFGHVDHRGGGRASARETVNWVMAGTVAEMLCRQLQPKLHVKTQILQVGPRKEDQLHGDGFASWMEKAKADGESYGALMELEISSPPVGLGEPIFNKIKAQMTQALMGVNAVTAVELGDGRQLAQEKGSELHQAGRERAYGGLRGGLTTGEDMRFQLTFKPTSSIGALAKQGRHDPCVALRAGPIVKALAWAVIADQLLMARLNRLESNLLPRESL